MTPVSIIKPGRARPIAYDEKGKYAGILLHQFEFTLSILTVGLKGRRIYNPFGIPLRLINVDISVDTAPTGAAIIIDVHKNGTTIFTNQAHRPQIAALSFHGSSDQIDVFFWNVGEYLTYYIDQIGSLIAGSNLTVQIIAQ